MNPRQYLLPPKGEGMTQKFIMIASSKGGVGKSTAALGITAALSRKGYKVLIADLDFGNACLDMLLGVQDSVICTVQDVAAGRASCEKALLKLKPRASKKKFGKGKNDNTAKGEVWLLPSSCGGVDCIPSYGGEDIEFGTDSVRTAVEEAAEHIGADYVILDTGAGVNSAVISAAEMSDIALVVTGHMPVALRSAEATAQRLSDFGVRDIRLIINAFDANGVIEEARRGVLSVIDNSRAPLAGIVPYDYKLMLSHEKAGVGSPDAYCAFSNIASRLEGENVPLFSNIKRLRKLKNKIYN